MIGKTTCLRLQSRSIVDSSGQRDNRNNIQVKNPNQQ